MVIGIYEAHPPEAPDLGWTRIATITATADRLHTDGDADFLAEVLKLPARHPEDETRLIESSEDPCAWAAALPDMLQGPQVVARIEDETDAKR